jgi:hypothetical protein
MPDVSWDSSTDFEAKTISNIAVYVFGSGYYTPVVGGPSEPCPLGDYKAASGNATSCTECRKPGTTWNLASTSKHDW